MKKIVLIILSGMLFFEMAAQEAEKNIMSGNTFYRNKKYLEAEFQYRKALTLSPGHPVATYNFASSLYRNENGSEAIGVLDTLLRTEKDNKIRSNRMKLRG